ncbi:MAG: hypothetical protein PHD76_05090 [Methylacidiphilales bacterium]|nr:hypothetical protein [Candidatus Methylacidiphilales bacterium]
MGGLVLAGCAAPNPKPFQDFSTATASVDTATDQALSEAIAQSREALINSIGPNDFDRLKLHFESNNGKQYYWGNSGDGSWNITGLEKNDADIEKGTAEVARARQPGDSTQAPSEASKWMNNYYVPQRMAEGISDFNGAYLKYTQALAALAGKEFISDDDFSKMAGNLNKNLNNATQHLKVGSGQEAAIFSTAATGAFREYIKSQQSAALRKAIQTNQNAIEEYSNLGLELTYNLSGYVRDAYVAKFKQLEKDFGSAAPDERKKVVANAVTLNDSTIKRWALFGGMAKLYASLPESHSELARAAEGSAGLSAIASMADTGAKLYKLYKDLNDANEKANKNSN